MDERVTKGLIYKDFLRHFGPRSELAVSVASDMIRDEDISPRECMHFLMRVCPSEASLEEKRSLIGLAMRYEKYINKIKGI